MVYAIMIIVHNPEERGGDVGLPAGLKDMKGLKASLKVSIRYFHYIHIKTDHRGGIGTQQHDRWI